MGRAFFMAVGAILLILALECVFVDEAVVHDTGVGLLFADAEQITSDAPATRVVQPPEWAPWMLATAGVVATLYGMSLGSLD